MSKAEINARVVEALAIVDELIDVSNDEENRIGQSGGRAPMTFGNELRRAKGALAEALTARMS